MLKLENVSKYYYSSTSVTCALRKINLKFDIGEFVAITGESGSGKTTLLNILSGQDSYEDGEMYYYDKKTSFFDDVDWENYRKDEIAFIFQNYNLIDSFTVLENVIVSYIIDGYSYSEAKQKSKEVLKLVGLENDLNKKATKLSGGQKQRLSIARALAKETNIIVADEPTGNLDVENGKSILELLKKVSKNKLLIVVTHNLSQIEPYITRKIRLHDGEIVLDEEILVSQRIDAIQNEKNIDKKEYKKIFNFSFLNIKSQPKKTILLLLLIILSTFASFIFYANFKANLDDNKTKELSTDFFYNFDDTRLIVMGNDSKVITDEIMASAKIDKVVSVEKYDYITDVNYFRPGDYKWILGGGLSEPDPNTGQSSFIDSSSITLVDFNKYMRSASSLTIDNLKDGRLPENDFEMVVYSNDSSLLGTKETVLFKNQRKWGLDVYYKYDVTIVGLLKEPTNQAYFSDTLCEIMDITMSDLNVCIYYYNKHGSLKQLKFNKIAIDPNIGEYDLSLSESKRQFLFYNDNVIPVNSFCVRYPSRDEFESYEINPNKSHSISDGVLGMSKEAFLKIYNKLIERKQFAIFLEDYSYTDEVMNNLLNMDFNVISCFRSSVTGYNVEKVIVRYVNLLISVIALLVINSVVVLLGYSILKIKKNDYVIFKMIGLTNKLIKKINIIELIVYSLFANTILIITFILVNNFTSNLLLIDVLKYIKFYDFVIILIVSLCSMFILAKQFNNFITRKAKITVLKEE